MPAAQHSQENWDSRSFLWSLILILIITLVRLNALPFWNDRTLSSFQILIEFSVFILLSLSLSRAANVLTNKSASRYRGAFLTSAAINLVTMIISMISGAHAWQTSLFLLTLFACLLGSFIASNLARGWWENNAQPSPQIEQDVLNRHSDYEPMGGQPHLIKRMLDLIVGLIFLVLSFPIWLLIAILVWWEDPGPVLFIKNSVGLGGVNFKQLKFRSMVTNAEQGTGPISGYENDERVLLFGRFIRKTALDELPQLINIFLGDMSFVGPRPQRTVLVHQYLQSIPEYAKRHQVRPGLAGLAQVTDSYDISPQEKLAWDLLYIERANLWLDFKLVCSAFILVFALRWLPKENPEHLIRNLLNVTKPEI